ncbi:hypothetical protein ACTFIV_007021 [Dictyostelium citrinum]
MSKQLFQPWCLLFGTCQCQNGYYGEDCSQFITPIDTLTTTSSYSTTTSDSTGPSGFECLNNCSNQGSCHNGICQCKNGYYGFDCSISNPQGSIENPMYCPNGCSGNGVCTQSGCICDYGFFGDGCQFTKNGKINCEFTESSVKVSSFTNITCTISGNGNCIDLVGRSQCKSNWGGYYWSNDNTECNVFQNEVRNSISCTGSQITCRSAFAVCSNNNGNYLVNGNNLDKETNTVELSQENSEIEKSSSSTLSIFFSLLIAVFSITNSLLLL